jgi:hypothetical protein
MQRPSLHCTRRQTSSRRQTARHRQAPAPASGWAPAPREAASASRKRAQNCTRDATRRWRKTTSRACLSWTRWRARNQTSQCQRTLARRRTPTAGRYCPVRFETKHKGTCECEKELTENRKVKLATEISHTIFGDKFFLHEVHFVRACLTGASHAVPVTEPLKFSSLVAGV